MGTRHPVVVWNVGTGNIFAELPVEDSVLSMQAEWSPDGRFLAQSTAPFSFDGGVAKSSDIRLTLWDVAAQRRVWQALQPSPSVKLAYSADSRLLAVAYAPTGGVDVFDVLTGNKLLHWQPTGIPNTHRLAFSPDSAYLAASGMSGSIRMLHLADLRKRLSDIGLGW